ncbi:MAG: hypothetical protein PHI28_03020 [Mangrovibacterium sp.]|nr:hypothetical protein [Mangrovibacterium sp.]
MEDKVIEKIFDIGVQVGVYKLATELGLIDEKMSEKQANKKYGEKQVKEWRQKRWIVGYPSGNSTRARYYFKRSELEIAARMLSMQNIIPANKLNQMI